MTPLTPWGVYKIDADVFYNELVKTLKGYLFDDPTEGKEAQNPFFIEDPVRRGKKLNGKKAILKHLGYMPTSEDTFERFRKNENLPIYQIGDRGRLWAFEGELNLWMADRKRVKK